MPEIHPYKGRPHTLKFIRDDDKLAVDTVLIDEEKIPICPSCGLPESKNNHPDAGKPPEYLEVGTSYVCIPCTVKSRHRWAERAMAAETEVERRQGWLSPEEVKKLVDTSSKGGVVMDAQLVPFALKEAGYLTPAEVEKLKAGYESTIAALTRLLKLSTNDSLEKKDG